MHVLMWRQMGGVTFLSFTFCELLLDKIRKLTSDALDKVPRILFLVQIILV